MLANCRSYPVPARYGLSFNFDGMNVNDIGLTIRGEPSALKPTWTGSGPAHSLHLSFSPRTYQRSSPGLALFEWSSSNQGANHSFNHRPSADSGGLDARTMRHFWFGFVDRSQPIMKTICSSRNCAASSMPMRSTG